MPYFLILSGMCCFCCQGLIIPPCVPLFLLASICEVGCAERSEFGVGLYLGFSGDLKGKDIPQFQILSYPFPYKYEEGSFSGTNATELLFFGVCGMESYVGASSTVQPGW